MTLFLFIMCYISFMIKVKVFDENHEKDLERNVNMFITNSTSEIIDIQFRTAVSIFGEDQIYCFSAMIIYKEK